MNVFDSIPDGFFNCLASSSNHRAYAGCLGAIYEQYSSAVSYRLPRTDIRDSLVIYLLQNHIELKEDGTEDLVTGNDRANFIIRKFVASGYIEEETDDITFEKYIVSKIRTFEITDKKIMTVENLTSFNRIKKSDTFFIFLSGYHNSAKQAFLTKIFSQNSNKEYYHFGDIDPDGFFILDNLRSKTQIDFKSYKMGISELQKYSSYTKPLEENDLRKAESLIAKGKYTEILDYMLKHNVKLEQEIISWKEINQQSN